MQGASMNEIETVFGVPKATQNSWFSKVTLPDDARRILDRKKMAALGNARKVAVTWHNSEKEKRIGVARLAAEETLSKINPTNTETLELALSILYLGEGFKTGRTGLGNSDPLILKFFLRTIVRLYDLDVMKMGFELHLRADQNPEEMKLFWAQELNVPINRFSKVSLDKRTLGKTTYPSYKGVCIVGCGNVAIQRKLVYLSRTFCDRVLKGLDENTRG